MKPWKRAILIAVFVLIFLAVGSFAIIYSQGWRLNLSTFRVTKVGAMYLRSFPKDAAITLDGKQVKNASWLLQNGTFINNLFPKEYRVRLSHDGFLIWQRTIAVAPSLVAEVKYAVLVPDKSTTVSTTTPGGERLWLSDDSFIVKDAKGLWFKGKKISGDAVHESSPGSPLALTRDERTSSFFVFDAATGSSTNISTAARRAGFDSDFSAVFNPQNSDELLLTDGISVARYQIAEKRFLFVKAATSSGPAVFQNPILPPSLGASRSYLAFASYDAKRALSRLAVYDPSSRRLLESATVPGKTVKLQFTSNDTAVLLQNDGELYRYSAVANSFTKIASDGVSFAATPDGARLAVAERNAVEVFSFAAPEDYRRFRLPDNAGVSRLVWYGDGEHLFVYYPDHVAFLDVDDLHLENFKTVSPDLNAAYNPSDNSLYEVKNGAVERLAFPG